MVVRVRALIYTWYVLYPYPSPVPTLAPAGLSVEGTLYNPTHFAAQLPDDAPIVFYIGAMASGHLTREENPEVIFFATYIFGPRAIRGRPFLFNCFLEVLSIWTIGFVFPHGSC